MNDHGQRHQSVVDECIHAAVFCISSLQMKLNLMATTDPFNPLTGTACSLVTFPFPGCFFFLFQTFYLPKFWMYLMPFDYHLLAIIFFHT